MKKNIVKRFQWAVALGAVLGGVGAVNAQDLPLPADNRWVVMIDASSANELNAQTEAARLKFRDELCESGIPEDHIFTYTTNAKDEAARPTRRNLAEILDALRDVSGSVALDPENSSFWRGDDANAPCEVQFYITARGVAFEKQGGKTRNFLLPCDVEPSEITGPDDERLLDVAEIEEALATPVEGTPIDRVFLAINFLSTATATRGGKARGARDVETRGAAPLDDLKYEDAQGFSYVRILTKNERLDNENVDSFYQTIAQGASGYADLAGNRDGLVGAVELAEYALAHGRAQSVDFTFNGSASYSIARSRREPVKVPSELFAELEAIFTDPENKALRESARKRKEGKGPSAKQNGKATTFDEVNGSESTRSGKKGGVLR